MSYTDYPSGSGVPTSRQVNTGTGLTGGGSLAADLTLAASTNLLTTDLVYFLDGGGSVIATGAAKGALPVDFNCTILEAVLLADQTGSLVVDIWKDSYANYPPTIADTIVASAPPTISSATKSKDTTLTGWTTAVTAGDILKFNVNSCSTITWAVVKLKVVKT